MIRYTREAQSEKYRRMVYARSAVRKIQAYEENGIYPGENLILTFETEKTILDIRIVKGLVERYLL